MWGLILKFAPRFAPFIRGAGGMVFAFVVGLAIGWWFCSDLNDDREQAKALESAILRAEQGKKDHEKIISISDQLYDSRASIVVLRDELDRVRRERLKAEQRHAKATEGVDSSTESRSAELLERGAILLERCGRLLQENASKHDALSKAMTP